MTRRTHSLDDLTGLIIGCGIEVINELGSGFLESVYENALLHALADKGIRAERQVAITVLFRDRIVGQYYADLVVEEQVVIELKVVEELHPRHQAQLINYLTATGKPAGLLLNFGSQKLEFKRCYPRRQIQIRSV